MRRKYGIIIVSLISVAFLFIVVYSFVSNLNQEKMANLKSVQVAEWKEDYDTGEYIILDVRTREEFEQSHIENAINIDFYSNSFESELNNLDKNKKYLIYCRSGARSSKTLDLMRELDFLEVKDLSGGIISWSKLGYKLVK